jgi:hypothetical protein
MLRDSLRFPLLQNFDLPQSSGAPRREQRLSSRKVQLICLKDTVDVCLPTKRTEAGRSAGREQVSIEQFRRQADECRRLAAAASNASDKAFWLNLLERWQALETQIGARPVRDKSRLRRSAVGNLD